MLGRVGLDQYHLARHDPAPTKRAATRHRRNAPRILLVLSLLLLVVRAPCVMAEDTAGEPSATPAGSSDEDIKALLLKVEQQIVDRHTLSPASDNAMLTWQRVTERAVSASPETLRALAHFATHLSTRATNELTVGRPDVSLDFAVVAVMATRWLGHNDDASAAAPETSSPAAAPETSSPAAAPETSSLESSPEPGQASVPPPPLPPVSLASRDPSVANEAGLSAKRLPTPTDQATPDRVSAPDPSPVLHVPTAQELSVAAQFASRGDQMLAVKDISAARRLYEYAANAGSAHAAAALAMTFDPTFIGQPGVIGPRPDPALAATWYRKAAALGDRDAEGRLQRLGAVSPQ